MFRESVSRFVAAEVAPYARRWREQGIVDREVYCKAGEAGLLCMWADTAFGGAGVRDLRYDQIVIEENVRGGEAGLYLHLHSNLVAPYVDELAIQSLRERLMPRIVSGETILAIAMTEPQAGSDLRAMRTRAIRSENGWKLTGAETYVSNGILADAVVVAARCGEADESPIGLFLVERGMPGFDRGRRLDKLGLAAQDTAEIFFDNVIVPDANVLGDPADGFRSLMRFLATERLVAAIASVAAAGTALDLTVGYSTERSAFGRRVGDFQHNGFRLASMRARIEVVQTYVDQMVLRANAGDLSPEEAAIAKLTASEVEGEMVDLGVQLHGGAGYMDEQRICRMYADARISRIFAGSSEVMLRIIARGMGLDR